MGEQISYSHLELDLMKRAMDPSNSYENMNKKPRYGLTNGASQQVPKTAPSNASFENYGYGNQSSTNAANALYSTPAGIAVNAMTTPNSAPATTAAPPSPYVSSSSSATGGVNPNMNAAAMYNSMGMNMGMMGMGGLGMGGLGMGMGGMGMGMPGTLNMGNMPMSGIGMGMFNANNNAAMGGVGSPFGYSPQLSSFPQSAGAMASPGFGPQPGGAGLNSPAAMNSFSMQMNTANYNPAVAAAAAAAANNATGRTVYIGSLPPSASVDELLNLVHFGPLESIRVLPSKSCVFLSFLDGATAAAFHADATIRKLSLHGQELKVGWGKASPVPGPVLVAIQQSGASRNVYVGGLDEGMTEEQLRDDLSRFGLIDQVKIVRDKNIGFVHFLSIATATKVVATLPSEPNWAGKRVNYGKDRCAYIPKSQQAAAAAAQVAAAQSLVAQSYATAAGMSPASATFGDIGNPSNPSVANLSVMAQAAVGTSLNRTIYLGNISPETTLEDLCNAIRGGVIQSIRYLPDKHIAFVTFIDPAAAFGFFQSATYGVVGPMAIAMASTGAVGSGGLTVNGRRVKVGWGKNSGPLPPQIAMAVHSGATRNVYVGNIGEGEWDSFTEERLRADFGEFGEIELVNYLKEKNCAFVNFTNITSAMKAIETIKSRPEYAELRISHGKDRCANPPRIPTGGVGGGGGRNRGPNSAQPQSAISEGTMALGLNGVLSEEDDDALLAQEVNFQGNGQGVLLEHEGIDEEAEALHRAEVEGLVDV